MKRKLDDAPDDNKRLRVDGASRAVPVTTKFDSVPVPNSEPQRPRGRINKLAPVRPFPTVPRSVSATGPRSAHKEGKNLICITRKTPLNDYLRRCKNLIIKDGYKTLHLSAMGAAIPHLLQLAVGLPPILPFAADEIHSDMTTGTMEVQDEILPEDEDEDITYRTRGKSTLLIVIKIGDGEFEGDTTGPAKRGPGLSKQKAPVGKPPKPGPSGSRIVVAEPDQEDMEI
ncbi:hypothetical protein FB45DRAFT_760203 [Roridomyces roridus]|uniref:Uncharacterized protein n=1 Tax=Roridomyces roridus TaxID=1738132 RepID=A0AAD7FCY3_9AGAR|nr:hypothetical protein FB45DRAFT_760203 [Roridomyces roridus]